MQRTVEQSWTAGCSRLLLPVPVPVLPLPVLPLPVLPLPMLPGTLPMLPMFILPVPPVPPVEGRVPIVGVVPPTGHVPVSGRVLLPVLGSTGTAPPVPPSSSGRGTPPAQAIWQPPDKQLQKHVGSEEPPAFAHNPR